MAELLEVAAVALGLACVADLAAVVDELVGEGDPAVLGQDAHQFLLDLLRRVALGQAQAARDAEDVGVDNHAFRLVEADAEDDVGGFAGCAGDGDQFGERLRDLAVEVGDDLLGGALDGLGLVVEEACCPDEGFQFRQGCLGHGCRGGEAAEELRSDHVDAHVGALGGEDGSDEQLPGGRVGEGALDGGIGLIEGFEDPGDAVGGEVAIGLARRGFGSGLRGCFLWHGRDGSV